MPREKKGNRAETTTTTVGGQVRELTRMVRDGHVSEVVRTLEEMTEERRRAVLSSESLLEAAVSRGENKQLVARLVDLGAVVPLMLPVRNDDGKTLDVLLSRGTKFNERDDPLFACMTGHHDDALSAVLCWGVEAGSSVRWDCGSEGRNIRLSSLEFLLQCHLAGDRLLLSCWCELRDEDLEDALGLFVVLGVDVSSTLCSNGLTALEVCTVRRDTRRMRLLLDAGADPRVSNLQGEVPLDFVTFGSPEKWDPLLQDLLFAGAVAPPLLVQCSRRRVGDAEALSWLMQAGSCFGDLSTSTVPEDSHFCLLGGCRGEVLRLFWHVLGPMLLGLRDKTGRTVLHHLSVPCHEHFFEADSDGVMHYGFIPGASTVVDDLTFALERGTDPNLTNRAAAPAIFAAVSYKDSTPTTIQKCATFVEELLSFGASLLPPPGQRHGPLKVNWECGGQLVELLLDRGADIGDLEDDDHARFLESLSRHCNSLGPAILRHFIESGLDLSLDPHFNASLHPHLVNVGRRWTPAITDTETIYLSGVDS